MNYKAILFDLDGTVVNTEEGVVNSIMYALDYFGIPDPGVEVIRQFIGPPLTGTFQNYFGMSDDEAFEAVLKFRERYINNGEFESSLYPGVYETLKNLKKQGFFIALCSSKNEPACNRILDYHEVSCYFDEIVGSSEDASREKKVEIIEEFFHRHPEYERFDVILIGDTKYDMEGAKLAGIDCVGVEHGFGSNEEMLEYGATCIFKDIRDVVDYVR